MGPATVSTARALELLQRLNGRHLTSRDGPEAREAVDAARNGGDARLLAQALVCLSGVRQVDGQCAEAVELADEAARICGAIGDRDGESAARYREGLAWWHQRRMTEALVALEKAAKIADEAGFRLRHVRCLNMIAAVLGYLGSSPECLKTYDRALELCQGPEFEADRLFVLNNKACNLLNRARATADTEQAAADATMAYELLVPDALELAERRLPSYLRGVRDTIGQCEILRGAADRALIIFEENLELAVQSGDALGRANSVVGLAEAMLSLGRTQEAADLCATLMEEFGSRLPPDSFSRMQLTWSKALRELGLFEQALTAFLAYHDLLRATNIDLAAQFTQHMTLTLELEREREEKRQIEVLTERLKLALAAAEAASRAKSEFLSNMSHELRTPLNAIIGFADIMRSQLFGDLPLRYRSYLEDIHRSGQHLLELINQLLDLSKVETGKLELKDEIIDLDQMISEAVTLVRQSALANGVNLVKQLSTGIRIQADALRIKQCLINLLSNAVKFTPAGGRVSVEVCADDSGATITVSDTGIGLAPEDVPRAFERFGQGGNARAMTGTGLGLPLTKELIELHGGSVELASTRGVGTIVTLRLPAERVVQAGRASIG